eukprot:62292-Chlamydomonas_euryale.AAC.1
MRPCTSFLSAPLSSARLASMSLHAGGGAGLAAVVIGAALEAAAGAAFSPAGRAVSPAAGEAALPAAAGRACLSAAGGARRSSAGGACICSTPASAPVVVELLRCAVKGVVVHG